MRRTVVKFLAAGTILLAAIGYLAYAGLKDGWVSYHLEVDDFRSSPKYRTQRVRLAGQVSEENLKMASGQLGVSFTLQGKSHQQAVNYRGVVPDMFKPGCEVVVEGKLDGAGVFQADSMLTKCASKYDSAEHDRKRAEKQSS